MTSLTRTELFMAWLARMWERISRPFLTCDGSRCTKSLFRIEFVDDDTGKLYVHTDDYGGVDACVYYCPWCGRRLKWSKEHGNAG